MTTRKTFQSQFGPRAMAAIYLGIALSVTVGAVRASAEEAAGPSFAFNIGANTDYVFRGISQTDEDPSVFGGVDATLGLGYAGVWVSNVDFGNGTDVEFDLYAGVKPSVGPVTFDLGVIYYGYTDQPSGSNEDYWEGKVAASVPAGPATLGAAVYYSPEFFGKTGDAWYYEVNAALPIPNTKFSVSGALGHQAVDIGPGYTTWNAGVGYALTDHIGLDVRYWDTAKDKFGDISSSRVVGGLKVVF
ncbi:TorF family putative porin [Phenylobacterium sp.]|uniref:TorF family putative porin n=1 Tax=Phenylobacterium sp. TaxID=1871053 RepID=UPI0025F8B6AE|nr:TorF family putative porin [Phenylobacterium sp.]